MLRVSTQVVLPLLSLSLVAACTGADLDELAGEADVDDVIEGKADVAPAGTYTYFAIAADIRRCASPMCGGFFLDKLNAANTTCHDGSRQAACYTPVLDWSESGLDEARQAELVSAAGRGAGGSGVYGIVRGRFARQNTTTPSPELGRFVVTEAWVAQGDGEADGIFAKVLENGIRCVAAPCPSLTEKALNSSRQANIAEVDFTAGALSEEAVDAVVGDLIAPSGILIAGYRFTFSIDGRSGKGRTATNAYRNLANMAPAEGECYVGGCSGQLCSETDGVISTCEWRDEYACYRDATCERQSDGTCGWTQTEALRACVDNNN